MWSVRNLCEILALFVSLFFYLQYFPSHFSIACMYFENQNPEVLFTGATKERFYHAKPLHVSAGIRHCELASTQICFLVMLLCQRDDIHTDIQCNKLTYCLSAIWPINPPNHHNAFRCFLFLSVWGGSSLFICFVK